MDMDKSAADREGRKRVGVYGGTFNPVHLGHMHVAEAAFQEIGLDKVLFVPSSSPPHKHKDLAPFSHRAAMLQLACQSHEAFDCNTIESTISSPSFTVTMLEALLSGKMLNDEFFFIIGTDAVLEIRTWKDYESVLERVHFIVVKRSGCDMRYLEHFFTELGYMNTASYWEGTGSKKRIHLLAAEPPGISSSAIRHGIRESSHLNSDVNSEVLRYIARHKLYTDL
jgi:nicotinate-nucleotide adenylyltransferase